MNEFSIPSTPASIKIRFLAYIAESLLFVLTLGIGWLIWYVIMAQQGLSPARQLFKLRIASSETLEIVTPGYAFIRGFGVYFLLFNAAAALLGSITFGLGFVFTIFSAILIFRENRQTLWDQLTKTIVIKSN